MLDAERWYALSGRPPPLCRALAGARGCTLALPARARPANQGLCDQPKAQRLPIAPLDAAAGRAHVRATDPHVGDASLRGARQGLPLALQ
eukprot:7360874-Prymnesium_polylepis.1